MKKIISLFILLALLYPAFTNAAAPECNKTSVGNTGPGSTTGNTSPGGAVGNTGSNNTLSNPVTGAPSLACLFYKIVDFVMSLSYVVIAFFLLLAGFKFVTAQGSAEKLTQAKTTFWYTVIGAFILIGANTIIAVVQTLISQLKG